MQATQITAERIKLQAKEKGVSAKKVLEICELGPNTITKMANGSDVVSQSLKKIADYLNCSVDYLLGRTDDPKAIYKNIQSSNVINGNNGNNSPLTVNGTDQLDEIESELLKNFRKISFPDKLRFVSDVMKKAEDKE